MPKPLVSIIAAIGERRELGKDNKLLWHIPEDMKHFKDLTSGHVVIMGRKTFESIGRLLPNRFNIIVTHNPSKIVEGAIFASSIEEALKIAKDIKTDEIFIIGGAQIYNQAISLADKLYLTLVKGIYDADVFFPDYSAFKKIISQKTINDGQITFLELAKGR